MKPRIHISTGTTLNYMNARMTVDFYSVYDEHDGLVIRTSSKTLAVRIYSKLLLAYNS